MEKVKIIVDTASDLTEQQIKKYDFGVMRFMSVFGDKSYATGIDITNEQFYDMLDKAKSLGYGAILFFGRPEYYPQFGFVEASTFGITDADGYNYPAFMGMELQVKYLAEAYGGKYYESDIYNDELNREAVKVFDKSFMQISSSQELRH